MSIASLAGQKASRVRAPAAPPAGAAGALAVTGAEDERARKTVSDALTAVATYIPSEIIAVYTLVIAMAVPDGGIGGDGRPVVAALPLWAFLVFLGAILPFTWLIYAVRQVESHEPIPWSPRQWPIWEAIASAAAFVAWSAALPRSAFLRYDWYSAALASIALVVVSLLLPLIGVLATRQARPS